MKLSNLQPAPGSVKAGKRIGRGPGSGKGGTSTRGHKGAKSRSGYKRKIGFEGGFLFRVITLLSKDTCIFLCISLSKVPLGPFTVILLPSNFTSTSDGTVIGLFPILDIYFSPLYF